jgi:hypothetical protein
MHQGTFEASVPEKGEGVSRLRGPGTLDLTPAGLRVQGKAIREPLVKGLSVVVGLVSFVAVLVVCAIIEDAAAGSDISGRFGAMLGIAGGLVGYIAGGMLLETILPGTPVDHVVPLSQMTSASVNGELLVFVSSDPACPGRVAFRSPAAPSIAAEVQRARA